MMKYDKPVAEKDSILCLMGHNDDYMALRLLTVVAESWAEARYAYKGVEICERLLDPKRRKRLNVPNWNEVYTLQKWFRQAAITNE